MLPLFSGKLNKVDRFIQLQGLFSKTDLHTAIQCSIIFYIPVILEKSHQLNGVFWPHINIGTL